MGNVVDISAKLFPFRRQSLLWAMIRRMHLARIIELNLVDNNCFLVIIVRVLGRIIELNFVDNNCFLVIIVRVLGAQLSWVDSNCIHASGCC